MSDIDPKKLKVAELKEELKTRGLDTKGTKAVLAKRLTKALKDEQSGTDESGAEGDSTFPEYLDTTTEEEEPPPVQPVEQFEPEVDESDQSDDGPDMPEPHPLVQEPEPVAQPPVLEEEPAFAPVAEAAPDLEPQVQSNNQEMAEQVSTESEPSPSEEMENGEDSCTAPNLEPMTGGQHYQPEPEAEPVAELKNEGESDMQYNQYEQNEESNGGENEAYPEEESNDQWNQDETSQDVKKETDNTGFQDFQQQGFNRQQQDAETVKQEGQDASEDAEQMEEKPATDQMETGEEQPKEETSGDQVAQDESKDDDRKDREDRKDRKRRHSRSRSPRRRSRSRERERDGDRRDRHRPRSRSRSRENGDKNQRSHSRERHRHRSRSQSPPRQSRWRGGFNQQPVEMESDDWVHLTTTQLDRYNSDLNLKIDGSGVKAHPLTVEGFAFMWSGARATYGVGYGKVAFEVKILDELNVSHLPPEETSTHVVRVGWSIDASSTQLGEEPFSYGFGGTGKASESCKFKNYGEEFGLNDVLGCYVDFECDPIVISYTKNGEDLGTCFEVAYEKLDGRPLFPHVLTKNCEFECNFGQLEEPMFPLKEGYQLIESYPVESRVRGALPQEKKEECEMMMMCGLPGCGKTTWAEKHQQANPEKRYVVLGTNNIIDKMKVMGLPRKRNYSGRWDILIDKSTKCLNRMFEIAARKKRNYILDQTNVYPSAQRRKMRPFEGFQRKAVVIVPTDEDFKNRVEKREKEEGKEVPDSAVLEMKANFQLPEVGNLFDAVEFIELESEEASTLVGEYNSEGKAALPPQEKRFRPDNRDGGRFGGRGGGRFDNRGGGGGGGGGRWGDRDGGRGGGGRDRGYSGRDDRQGGYNRGGRDRDNRDDRRGGGGFRGRGGRGGWEDGGYDRRNQGGYGGGRERYNSGGSGGAGSGGGGRQGSRWSQDNSRNDQQSNYWGNQGGQGGGWNKQQSGTASTAQSSNQAQSWNQQGQWGQQASQWGQQASQWAQQQPAANAWSQSQWSQWPGYGQQATTAATTAATAQTGTYDANAYNQSQQYYQQYWSNPQNYSQWYNYQQQQQAAGTGQTGTGTTQPAAQK